MNRYMKPVRIVLLLMLAIGIKANAQYHSCYDISIQQIQKDEDCVNVDYTIYVNPAEVGSCEFVFMELYLENEGHRRKLTSVLLNGEMKMKTYRRANALGRLEERLSAADHVFSAREPSVYLFHEDCVPYEEWMNGATLFARQSVGCEASDKIFELATLHIPEEAKVESPVLPAEEPAEEATPPAVLQQVREGVAYFDFPVGKSTLNLDFGRNREEWANIIQQIQQIEAADNTRIIRIEITGYASPEGSYALNERLAYERARAISNRLLLDEALSLSQEQIATNFVAEDWDGLVRLLKDSSMPHREEVLSIIENIEIFDGREKALMNLAQGNVYRTLLRYYFPQLRRTEYKIIYEEEIKDVNY